MSHSYLPFVLLPIVVFSSGFVAVDRPPEPAGIFVEDGPPQPPERLTGSCPSAPSEVCAGGATPFEERCEVVETSDLGSFDGTRYLLARYRRSRTFDPEEDAEPYVCESDEIALAALRPDGQAQVVWRDATEREFLFLSSAKLSRAPDGRRILAVLYCMNGTGGCAQGALIWAAQGWRALERDASWDPVYEALPPGYRPHKSPEIDFESLTWKQHLAHVTDPNCCPSGKILFHLKIVDDRLGVESHEIVFPETDYTQRLVERLMARPAASIDSRLPLGAMGTWLDEVIPKGAGRRYEINDCGEQTGDPAVDRGRSFPACLEVDIDLVSRERRVALSFDATSLAYREGSLTSPDLDSPRNVAALSDLPPLLVEAIPPRPLECPTKTVRRHEPERAGSREWCEDDAGRKQGPSRSWYSTGIYLMEKGAYHEGDKSGEWTECTRFERCVLRSHPLRPVPGP